MTPGSTLPDTTPRRRVAEIHLFETCTLRCGYCWFAQSGGVLDMSQLERFREPDFVHRFTSFFTSRTTVDQKWLLLLTGGEPLITPNLDRLLTQVLEAGNRAGYYTALMIGPNHPGFRFLLQHPYPATEYVMASLHPESEADEPRFFEKVRMLKDAGHKVFVRFVGHPQRLHRLSELSERCRGLDVCFYPTTLLSDHYPGGYTASEKSVLRSHFSSLSQQIQLEGGLDTTGLVCRGGSAVIFIHMQTGNITPCATVHTPSLGNIFEDRLTLNTDPIHCPEPGIDCVCDVHFQQGIVPGADEEARFVQISKGFTEPKDYTDELHELRGRGIGFYPQKKTGIGIGDDNRLFYRIEEVRENYRKTRNLPRTTLGNRSLHEIPRSFRNMRSCGNAGHLDIGTPTRIVTPPEPWSWAASLPLSVPGNAIGEIWLRIRAVIVRGEAGFGILDRTGTAFQDRCFVKAGASNTTFFLKISDGSNASSLIVENAGLEGEPAEVLLEGAALLVASETTRPVF